MTKILEIYGDGDYCAVSYEDAISSGEVVARELWNESKDAGHKTLEYENEETDTYFEYKAYEFGEIDPKFLSLMLDDICDYDNLKHHCIYVID